MRIFKRGKVYWFEFVYLKQRYQQSTAQANRRVAEDLAATFRTALIKGEFGITEKKRVPSLGEALTAFLSWSKTEHADHPNTTHRYATSSKALLRTFPVKTPLDKITAADVESYKEKRAQSVKLNRFGKPLKSRKTIRPATVNRELACLKAVFNHALKAGLPFRNPVDAVGFLDEDNLQERVVSYTEQERYLGAASEQLADVATLMVEQGFRPGEVYALRDVAVNLEANTVKVLKGKTKAARRTLDLTPEGHRVLAKRLRMVEAQRAQTSTVIPGWLFPHEGDPLRHIPKVDSQHTAALAASKVPPFRLYDLRHTFATRFAEGVPDPVALSAVLGHAKLQMVMRYIHPTQQHQRSAMARAAEHNAAARAREKAKLAQREAEGKVVPLRRAV